MKNFSFKVERFLIEIIIKKNIINLLMQIK